MLRYIWEYPNVLNEKVHKYSNTTSVLTTEQMFLWELNNSIFPHYLHVMNCSDTTKHRWQSKLLAYVWTVLWLQLYLVKDLPRVEVSSHLQSNRTYLYNSVLFVQTQQSVIFISHSWLVFRILWTVSHLSRLLGYSLEPGSSVGQPQHNPLSHLLHCFLSHCSFAEKKQIKKPPIKFHI